MAGHLRQDWKGFLRITRWPATALHPGGSHRFATLGAELARNASTGPGKVHYVADSTFRANAIDRNFFDIQTGRIGVVFRWYTGLG